MLLSTWGSIVPKAFLLGHGIQQKVITAIQGNFGEGGGRQRRGKSSQFKSCIKLLQVHITFKAGVQLLRWLWGAVAQWSEHLQLKQEALSSIPSSYPGFFFTSSWLSY